MEFVFSKIMHELADLQDEETGEVLTTGIYFNDKVASNQIVINYEKVRYPYSVSEGSECSLVIEAGTLTDMQLVLTIKILYSRKLQPLPVFRWKLTKQCLMLLLMTEEE